MVHIPHSGSTLLWRLGPDTFFESLKRFQLAEPILMAVYDCLHFSACSSRACLLQLVLSWLSYQAWVLHVNCLFFFRFTLINSPTSDFNYCIAKLSWGHFSFTLKRTNVGCRSYHLGCTPCRQTAWFKSDLCLLFTHFWFYWLFSTQ